MYLAVSLLVTFILLIIIIFFTIRNIYCEKILYSLIWCWFNSELTVNYQLLHNAVLSYYIVLEFLYSIDTWTFVNDDDSHTVGKIHDLFCVRVMRGPKAICSDPLKGCSFFSSNVPKFKMLMRSQTTLYLLSLTYWVLPVILQ